MQGHLLAGLDPQFPGQGGSQDHPIGRIRQLGQAKALINAQDRYPVESASGRFIGTGTEDDRGSSLFDRQTIGEFGLEEPTADQGLIDPAQPAQGQVAQTAAQRIADQQGPGQHRRAHDHAQHHGQVGAPVIKQVTEEQARQGHVSALQWQRPGCRRPSPGCAGTGWPVPGCA